MGGCSFNPLSVILKENKLIGPNYIGPNYIDWKRNLNLVLTAEEYKFVLAKGTPVRDHVLKIIAHLNELDILGAEIDGESQVDIMLILYLSPIRTSALITP